MPVLHSPLDQQKITSFGGSMQNLTRRELLTKFSAFTIGAGVMALMLANCKSGVGSTDVATGSLQLIDGDYTDCDCIALHDINGDGRMDVVAAQSTEANRALYWYAQQDPHTWTKHTIDADPASFGTEVESAAIVELEGKICVLSGDQNEGAIRIYTPSTPGDPTGSWTKTKLVTGYTWLMGTWAYDIDEDGISEIVFAYEGTNSTTGGICYLDFDGTDPMDADDWSVYQICTHPGAHWIARQAIEIAGNGRDDLVFAARNQLGRNPETVPGIYWLEKPANPTEIWTIHTIDDRVADWHKVDIGNFSGDANGKDIVATDRNNDYKIATYRFSDNFSRTDIVPAAGSQAWNLRTVPAVNGVGANGRDAFLLPHENSYLYLYQWNGNTWIGSALDFYETQIHPLDNIILWHDIDGDGKEEAFIADSSTTDSKLVWIKVEPRAHKQHLINIRR
jgi:hypothetical protein